MPHQTPASGRTSALLMGGLAVLLVGVFTVGGLLAQRVEPASQTLAAAPSAPPVAPSTTAPQPTVTPSRNPRRQPDVDRGKPIDHGVYVEIAPGWTTAFEFTFELDLVSWDRGAAATFYVQTRPLPSRPLILPDAAAFAEHQLLHGYKPGRPRVLPVPNPNIVEAVSVSFTGRRRMDEVTYSLYGECVRLRGDPETNDVSLSVCWAAYVQDLETVRPEVQRMIASAARSI
jgi:hypothetical protein